MSPGHVDLRAGMHREVIGLALGALIGVILTVALWRIPPVRWIGPIVVLLLLALLANRVWVEFRIGLAVVLMEPAAGEWAHQRRVTGSLPRGAAAFDTDEVDRILGGLLEEPQRGTYTIQSDLEHNKHTITLYADSPSIMEQATEDLSNLFEASGGTVLVART